MFRTPRIQARYKISFIFLYHIINYANAGAQRHSFAKVLSLANFATARNSLNSSLRERTWAYSARPDAPRPRANPSFSRQDPPSLIQTPIIWRSADVIIFDRSVVPGLAPPEVVCWRPKLAATSTCFSLPLLSPPGIPEGSSNWRQCGTPASVRYGCIFSTNDVGIGEKKN